MNNRNHLIDTRETNDHLEDDTSYRRVTPRMSRKRYRGNNTPHPDSPILPPITISPPTTTPTNVPTTIKQENSNSPVWSLQKEIPPVANKKRRRLSSNSSDENTVATSPQKVLFISNEKQSPLLSSPPSSSLSISTSTDDWNPSIGQNVLIVKKKSRRFDALANAPRPFYDIAFHVQDSCLYSSRAILCCRSTCFWKLICKVMNEYADKDMMNEAQSFIEFDITRNEVKEDSGTIKATVSIYRRVLEFAASGCLFQFDCVEEAVDLFAYSNKISYHSLQHIVLSHIVQSLIDRDCEHTNIQSIVASLSSIHANSTRKQKKDVTNELKLAMGVNIHSIFASKQLLKASEVAISRALHSDVSVESESKLFLDLLLWGTFKLYSNGDCREICTLNSTDRVFVHKNTKLGYRLHFYRSGNEKIVELAQYNRLEQRTIAHVTVSSLRSYLAQILPLIRYETLTREDIFESVEPTMLFTPQELLLFIKAACNLGQSESLLLLGMALPVRSKRTISN